MDRKGMEVSIGMIITIIIAVVTLAVALAFIQGWFSKLGNSFDFEPLKVQPTSDDPIQFVPSEAARGKKTPLTVGFYNNEAADIPASVVPTITCQGIASVTVEAAGLAIPVGEAKEYRAFLTVPKDTKTDQYSCVMTISETEKTFFLTVK